MSTIFDMEFSMTDLTYREKWLYVCLLTDAVVVVALFIYLRVSPSDQWHVSIAIALGLGVRSIGLHIGSWLTDRSSNDHVTDERDNLISSRGTLMAYTVLGMGMFFIFILYCADPELTATQIVKGLFAIHVLSNIARSVTQLRLQLRQL